MPARPGRSDESRGSRARPRPVAQRPADGAPSNIAEPAGWPTTGNCQQPCCRQPVNVLAPAQLHGDEPGLLQHSKVLRDRQPRMLEPRRDAPGRHLPAAGMQDSEHGSAGTSARARRTPTSDVCPGPPAAAPSAPSWPAPRDARAPASQGHCRYRGLYLRNGRNRRPVFLSGTAGPQALNLQRDRSP